ncbi:interleukin-13 receptor subunit alpha-1 [Onychostoma macrolepis]|uniref:Fibronectin type-III domain-containing protein n=1 Tax=Onychostoma macrolepis TaxID=369639 RepID=A0A7J6CWE8_9TELE|nr:interleukin-13 receptor subunit alpha-1 [Onychostoma macrolepis]KAF4111431.1 hypothetical protein G5714_008462 [Onychostoma macrolepis]
MFRVWDISLMMCFSVSLMFVGVEGMSELPPPRNLTFTWETPFTLNLKWEKPKNLDPGCKVNYTVEVRHSQDCPVKAEQDNQRDSQTRRVQNTTCKFNISNENGLCISVTVNPEICGIKDPSPSLNISIPPPTVTLVKDRSYEYFNNTLKCTWSPVEVVQDLGFYYWSPHKNTVIKCNDMKIGQCVIHDTFPKYTTNMFYLFNGTYKGKPVNNTFMDKPPTQYVKINKPQLTIQRDQQNLLFQTNSYLEFGPQCYRYNYTYSMCDKIAPGKVIENKEYQVDYDSNCKYKARVQIIFYDNCGEGQSDLSDEVEYGENRDPNLPALLAVIIIPFIVSCCLIVSLVLLRRHKDIIFPKIPEPTLIFKDMFINNIRIPEDLRHQSPTDGRLYVPIEEIVESKISLELETPLIPTTTNVAGI